MTLEDKRELTEISNELNKVIEKEVEAIEEFVKEKKEAEIKAANEKNQESEDSKYPSKNETWYTYLGLGSGSVKLEVLADYIKQGNNTKYDKGVLDLFGFYWPKKINVMHGFLLSILNDRYESSKGELEIAQMMFSYSYLKIFGSNIGSGLFLRGDA